MSQARSFQFLDYKIYASQRRVVFNYRYDLYGGKSLDFSEEIILPVGADFVGTDKSLLKEVLSGVHLMLGISYFKAYCPSKIIVPYKLTKQQADFWTGVYRHGLAEFYYRNKLDPKSAPIFPVSASARGQAKPLARTNRALVGIGGGKDSIVAVELLKKEKIPLFAFIVETQKKSVIESDVAAIAGLPVLKVRRHLDEKILSPLPGGYNGHVPISAIFAWLGYLTALLCDYSYVVVGNEHSSNFGNLTYRGETINHKWSGSSEFEAMFQQYAKENLIPQITYFSALRAFYEIRMVKIFSRYPKYFKHFTSCNGNFKVYNRRNKTLWCGNCPKCAYVFALLAAHLPKKTVISIYGKNMFADESLAPLYRDLLGWGKLKPFDCVGTFEETRAALWLARKKFSSDVIIKKFVPKIKNGEALVKKVMTSQSAPTVPERFRFLGVESVYILGYAREGKVNEQFIKKYYPQIRVGRGDKKFSADYLAKQKDYDLVIKTAGISPDKVTRPYTTATGIFLSRIKNPIIGVTGSKGKSTTASLIYRMLRAGGLKVELLGNIGQPMLQKLLKKNDSRTIYILELSSYQLSDVKISPWIAVVTNLFPEHMTWHGGEEPYYQAKKNIINFQTADDYFIYNLADRRLRRWAQEARASTLPFADKMPVDKKQLQLLGRHNESNVRAAVAVAKLLSVSNTKIVQALKKFKGLPHRLEFIGKFKDIKFYDDAISTTPESTIMALKSLKNVGTIFLGGEDRGYDFKALTALIKKLKIKNIVLFPDSGSKIIKASAGLNILRTKDMEEAVRFAYRHTTRGQICLLSTASPSYSVWSGFEEKGALFQKWARYYGN